MHVKRTRFKINSGVKFKVRCLDEIVLNDWRNKMTTNNATVVDINDCNIDSDIN